MIPFSIVSPRSVGQIGITENKHGLPVKDGMIPASNNLYERRHPSTSSLDVSNG